jgi:hypothetical protein
VERAKRSATATKRGSQKAKVGLVAVISVTACMALASCSSQSSSRSVAAYCRTFYQQGTQFRSEFMNANSSSDPLSGVVDLISAPAQLANFFGDLAEVAPTSIEPQVAQIQAAFQQEVNGATSDLTNPLGGLIGAFASAIETGPAWEAVNNWTDTNCGPPPGTKWLSASS